jgi:hypothetical protein
LFPVIDLKAGAVSWPHVCLYTSHTEKQTSHWAVENGACLAQTPWIPCWGGMGVCVCVFVMGLLAITLH